MNIVYILDKAKADKLSMLGFDYQEKKINDKKVYQFFGTDNLMKELGSHFEQGSFFVSKTLCF